MPFRLVPGFPTAPKDLGLQAHGGGPGVGLVVAQEESLHLGHPAAAAGGPVTATALCFHPKYEKPRPYTREDRMYGVTMYDRTWQVRYS